MIPLEVSRLRSATRFRDNPPFYMLEYDFFRCGEFELPQVNIFVSYTSTKFFLD